MATLGHAIAIAAEAHKRQYDRAGKPYILHPLRIMMRMTSEQDMIAAILHDVVEDTDWTIDLLRAEGFAEEILFAVDCLTKRDGEPYQALIDRAKHSPIARRVKIGDLEDNMDIKRVGVLSTHDMERLARYHAAWVELQSDSSKM